MNEMDPTLDDSLAELEQLLEEETVALRYLDRDAIDRLAALKLGLCERLTRQATSAPRPADRAPQLERIRHKALHNQVLLVHARDSVRGVLALLTGDRAGSGHSASGDGFRLDVRV